MREEEMEGAVGALDKCYTDGDATAKQIPNSFSSIMNTGLLNTGINTIVDQINSITTSIFNVKSIMKKHSTEMFNMDRNMANIAEKIEVPQDFVKNNSMQEKSFEEYMFSKVDGKSVNSGDATVNRVDANADTTVTKENLSNINDSSNVQNVNVDGDTTVVAANLNNISQNAQAGNVNTDFTSSVASENLTDINNGEEAGKVETTDDTTVNNQNLRNINNGEEIKNVEVVNETTINNQDLRNINNETLSDMNSNSQSYDNQVLTNTSNADTMIRKPHNSEEENDNE